MSNMKDNTQDTFNLKGDFSVQCIDVDGNVIDEYQEQNMIMELSRKSMAEIFAMKDGSKSIHRIKFGTSGHIGTNIISPKSVNQGFVKERDRLFSDALDVVDNGILDTIITNDLLKFVSPTRVGAEENRLYRYLGPGAELLQISTVDFTATELWKDEGTIEPYTYWVDFDLPGFDNVEADNISERDTGSGSSVTVSQENEIVKFTFDLSTVAGNGANGDVTSVYTEAALYANDRIFSMKTFKAKVKDSTILLRIVWAISF